MSATRRSKARELPQCQVEGCPDSCCSLVNPHCKRHYEQIRTKGFISKVGKNRPSGAGSLLNGYVMVRHKGKKVAQHRLVMEQHLGRTLLEGESVHHRNGVRSDNRTSNLELWVTNQVPGQLIADKVAWAKEVLKRYPLPPTKGSLEASAEQQSLLWDEAITAYVDGPLNALTPWSRKAYFNALQSKAFVFWHGRHLRDAPTDALLWFEELERSYKASMVDLYKRVARVVLRFSCQSGLSDRLILFPNNDGTFNKGCPCVQGYIQVCVQGRVMKEHRLVMEQHLGRKLLAHENVHHKDGDRSNNSILNLELWSTSQPAGQRVQDLVDWAHEVLNLYGDRESAIAAE